MFNDQLRCKNCGRPISIDEQQNFFSFCYDCFKDYKLSQMRKATVMRIIGIVGLVFVCFYIFLFGFIFLFIGSLWGGVRPLRVMVFIIVSIIAILIPALLIFFGIKKKREWSTIFKAKPIETQEIISILPKNTIPVQMKFCPECGSKLVDPNQKFCVNCGYEINL